MDLNDLKDFVSSVKSALKNEISALIAMEVEGEGSKEKEPWPIQYLSQRHNSKWSNLILIFQTEIK